MGEEVWGLGGVLSLGTICAGKKGSGEKQKKEREGEP